MPKEKKITLYNNFNLLLDLAIKTVYSEYAEIGQFLSVSMSFFGKPISNRYVIEVYYTKVIDKTRLSKIYLTKQAFNAGRTRGGRRAACDDRIVYKSKN
jgi:hypothetical protein